MKKFYAWLKGVNWWAVASVLILLGMVLIAYPPNEPVLVAYDWLVTLGFASVVCALFAIFTALSDR